jgi:hypothetical protein
MAQSQNPLEGTIASGLGKMAENVYDTLSKVGNLGKKTPTPGQSAPKPDTSWHDEMVREASDSFVKAKPATSHQAGQQRITKKYGKLHK